MRCIDADELLKKPLDMANYPSSFVRAEPTDDCVAIEFSADVNEPNKWQSKDGEWHTGKIPTKTESEET